MHKLPKVPNLPNSNNVKYTRKYGKNLPSMAKFSYGDYPIEYDPKKHGPYDPARYYGKPDTPFGDVKLVELPAWLLRRSYTPSAMLGACSRAWWRWQHKYMQPRRVGIAPFFQLLVASMAFFYLINYGRMKNHRNAKYH